MATQQATYENKNILNNSIHVTQSCYKLLQLLQDALDIIKIMMNLWLNEKIMLNSKDNTL